MKQEQPGVSALWLSWQAARDKEEGAQESGEDREQGGKMWSAPRAASILPYFPLSQEPVPAKTSAVERGPGEHTGDAKTYEVSSHRQPGKRGFTP